MGIHRTQNGPREKRLWRMVIQADRFMSLTLKKPYSGSAGGYELGSTGSVEDSTDRNPKPDESRMMNLALLVGRVLDMVRSDQPPPYSSVLALDLELNHFGSCMPSEPWHADPELVQPPEGLSLKAADKQFKHILFLHTKLVLHLQWMLKYPTDTSLEYSRLSCLDASRGIIRLCQSIRKWDLDLTSANKCTPHRLMSFTAAATLILGQMGSISEWDNVQQFQEDEELVKCVIEAFSKIPTKTGQQSTFILGQLIQLRNRQVSGQEMPSKITIPLIGTVDIPRQLPVEQFLSQQEQECPDLFDMYHEVAMPNPWPNVYSFPSSGTLGSSWYNGQDAQSIWR
jgi:hypothetical protein